MSGHLNTHEEDPAHSGDESATERCLEASFVFLQRGLSLAFVAAVLLNFINVIGRYGFGRTADWADELQVFTLIAMAFIGAAVTSWRGRHLRMDVLLRALPPRWQKQLRLLELVLVLVLSGVVLSQSVNYVRTLFRIGQTSDVGGIPLWIPHCSLMIGFALILVSTGWRLCELLRGRRSMH